MSRDTVNQGVEERRKTAENMIFCDDGNAGAVHFVASLPFVTDDEAMDEPSWHRY
jgi:hypothetical protein